MSRNQSQPHPAFLLTTAVMAIAATALFALGRRNSSLPERNGGFRDGLAGSGIDFRMSFLPEEQGAAFRVNLYDHGCGVAVADYDGDGDDDVFFLNQLGANGLYRNRGDGTFDNVTDESGPLALDDRICVGAAFSDYDNDGDQDLYVTSTRGGNVLFENQGGGHFRDVTEAAGVSCVRHSQTPVFFDYDNDGYLDLFVTNTARWTTDDYDAQAHYYRGPSDLWQIALKTEVRESNVLFRNNRDGTFRDATADAGLAGGGWSGDVAVFDFDEDGDPDLLVTNMFGMSQLYRNDGQGHFDNVSRQALRRTSLGAIGAKVFDFNGDGRLDLFITDMHSDMWIRADEPGVVEPHVKYRYLNGPRVELHPEKVAQEESAMELLGVDYESVIFGNTLFRNDGGGRFTELSDAANVETFWPWGIAVGDFDNDADEDLYIPSGMGYPYFYYPSSMLLNKGDGTFVDRAREAGLEPPPGGQVLSELIFGRQAARSSRCAATADFDGDGRLDLVVNNFNAVPYYFKNQFPPRHYIDLRLRGTKSNRDAIGALVKLFRAGRVMVRQVNCTGGYLSQSSKTLHFGLGDDAKIDRVEIHWPSGVKQVLASLDADRSHEIVEPDDDLLE